jgi:NADPH-dependent 2,4-dienoyl-CoA reductase/sulfur reductase-like enzyme
LARAAVQGRTASLACVRDRRTGAFELVPGRVIRVAKQTRHVHLRGAFGARSGDAPRQRRAWADLRLGVDDCRRPLYYASLLFLLLTFSGPGSWSLDAWLQKSVGRRPLLPGKRPHVVIVGAGFGGLKCASGLKEEAVDVTLIDRNNYHLFQPLLYQVATAGLSPADIAFSNPRSVSR